MRYFILPLLFSYLCQAQNEKPEGYTKVTAYRLVQDTDDGPCSVLDCVRVPEGGIVFTTESTDPVMISNLHKLKKAARKWRSEQYYCGIWDIGGIDIIPNMFVFSGHTVNDTLFTTENNMAIVFPNKHEQYIDPSQKIKQSLTNDFAEFFKRNFREDMWFSTIGILDSVSNNRVLYKEREINRIKKIEDISSKAFLIEVDSVYNGNDSIMEAKTYLLDRNIYSFDYNGELKTIEIFNIVDYYIDGIKPGDNEDILMKKYPNSTKRQFPIGTTYEEIKHNYDYVVNIENKNGNVIYSIKNNVINSITLSFL